MTPNEIHNRDVPQIVESIIRPMLEEAGGDTTDILVVLETVITGVMLYCVLDGGDDEVGDALLERVKVRLAELRARRKAKNN